MTSIPLPADRGKCNVIVGSDLLDRVGTLISKHLHEARKLDGQRPSSMQSRCAIVTDTNVGPIFGEPVKSSVTNADFEPVLITIPAGEHSKTLEQVGKICDEMIAARLDRQSFVIGLGGGVIGDISGFVAAVFQRGIPHVQIPTTLLAMVDSSIGGKTGVNTRAGKNLLGAVHHPAIVIDDVNTLKTLPAREFQQGFAEIIKHGVIADAEMFRDLIKLDRLNRSSLGDRDRLVALIRRNIEIKSRIVATDERDRTGQRAVLNFGHTIGHAIERAGDYKTFLHGEGISLGMVAAAAISSKRAGLTAADRDQIVELLTKFGLPTRLPRDVSRQQIFDALKFDKKFESGEIRFVVTPQIGSARLSHDVTLEDIQEAVEKL